MRCESLLLLLLLASALTGAWSEGQDPLRCKGACESCLDVAVRSVFVELEFVTCNVCGGVKFTVECDVTDSATENKESVAVEVAAGEFENISGIYFVTADCSRNILLTKRYKKENKRGKDVMVDMVLDTQRVSVDNGAMLFVSVPKETMSDPRDPLAPGAQPKGEEILTCAVK